MNYRNRKTAEANSLKKQLSDFGIDTTEMAQIDVIEEYRRHILRLEQLLIENQAEIPMWAYWIICIMQIKILY